MALDRKGVIDYIRKHKHLFSLRGWDKAADLGTNNIVWKVINEKKGTGGYPHKFTDDHVKKLNAVIDSLQIKN